MPGSDHHLDDHLDHHLEQRHRNALSARPGRVPRVTRCRLWATAAAIVGAATFGAGSEAGAQPHSGTAANVAITKALGVAIRNSFYHDYRVDPHPQDAYGVPPGQPESRVRDNGVTLAGVIYGASAKTNSYWVIADICFNTPTGCEDMGAFDVFHRTGQTGYFSYPEDICKIPKPLAKHWFPDGRYPMGGHCPSPPQA